MFDYPYTKTPVNLTKLEGEIEASAIVIALAHIDFTEPNELVVFFKGALSEGDETILNGLIIAHDGAATPAEAPVPRDSNNSPIMRTKTTQVGWHFQPRYITFTTAKYGSLHNRKSDTITDYGDATLRFWKIVANAWVELALDDYADADAFQTAITAECTITTTDWYGTFDFDIRGGVFVLGPAPVAPTWGYALMAPDIPAHLGGSVPFLDGGIPIHLMKSNSILGHDALTVKSFLYDPIYKSNKVRLIVDHAVGAQTTMAISYQLYKL